MSSGDFVAKILSSGEVENPCGGLKRVWVLESLRRGVAGVRTQGDGFVRQEQRKGAARTGVRETQWFGDSWV